MARPFPRKRPAGARRRGAAAVLLVALLAPAVLGAPAAEAPPKTPPPAKRIAYGPPRQIATLANGRVTESSGLAASRRFPGVFWTHNDSGDGPRLYAFNRKGEHLATCTLLGVTARDWEDVASFKSPAGSFLLVADVGDNDAERKACVVYVVAEPAVGTAEKPLEKQVRPEHRITFTYEDGPRDCEALAIDPTSGTMYLVSKEGAGRVYELPWPRGPAGPTPGPLVAKPIATVIAPYATALDISPDGRRAVVLTYADAYEYVRGPGETWAQAFARKGRVLKMPRRNQGESVCYGPDGAALYLTSEFAPTPLLEVPVAGPAPEKADPAPGAKDAG